MTVLAQRAIGTPADRVFYPAMAIALAAVVFLGFAPTFYLRGYVALPEGVTVPLSPLKIVHGIIATAWMCLFAAQTWLVATARVSTHRRLGLLGAIIAVGMVATGAAMTVDALRRGVDPMNVDPRVWWLGNTLPPVLLFAVLVGAALALRRRVHAHKRLMLLATINLVGPALGRVALFNLDASLVTPFAVSTLLGLVLVPTLYDLIMRRRVHPALILGGTATIIGPWLMSAVARTPAGLALADWFL
ncbi:MAG TPA: hypothetical protein VFV95_02575 [Vicinamibacterales bacterium]|nr:hypothetical protein [Vicinamibacterales bacterium]